MEEEKKITEKETKKEVKEEPKKDEKKVEEKVKTDEKKESKTKKDEKKKNKKSKKGLVVFLVILVVIIALAVIGYFVALKYQEKTANEYVDELFIGLKSDDYSEQEKYIEFNELLGSGANTDEADSAEEISVFFDKLDYKILDTKADFQKATIEVEVSNKDMGTFITNYFSKVIQLAFASAFSEDYTEEMVDAELTKYLQEQVNSEEIQTVTNTITIELGKKDGQWDITSDKDELTNVILPGFMEKLESIGNSFSDLAEEE